MAVDRVPTDAEFMSRMRQRSREVSSPGMDVRTWLAGQVLTGLSARDSVPGVSLDDPVPDYASFAVALADAVLEELERDRSESMTAMICCGCGQTAVVHESGMCPACNGAEPGGDGS